MSQISFKINYISYSINSFHFYKMLSLIEKSNFKLNIIGLPIFKKKITLVKSPKCYKVGKLNLLYKIKNFFIKINKINKYTLTLKYFLKYFLFLKKKYLIYQNNLIKINKLTITGYSTYNLRINMLSLILIIFCIYSITSLSFIGGLVYVFLSFLFMFLQVLFFTTCERKLLALSQRRLGPKVVGDMGRLQYFADALKLIAKSYIGPRKINSLFFSGAAVAAFWFSWYSFSNLSFNYGEDIMDIEYNIFFGICCSLGFSVAWLVSGWSSVSKYALLGCIRAALQIISYEIMMSAIFLILFIIAGTVNFEIFIDTQINYSIFLFTPLVGISCFIATLMETNRPPFDLSEAESDVIAGYTVEYAGIMFGLFYLGEYVNLFTNSFITVILFSGGWWNIISYFIYFKNELISLFYSSGLIYTLEPSIINNFTTYNYSLYSDILYYFFFNLDEYKNEYFYLK